ncbi:MAG: T9SS type A sorting domain-containing protein [Bacteroidales bacterium]|jgi:hypothetical protein|nr:T9SS type A sorting domain-containing protein [Bacteroidales bacterium]
MKKNSILIFFLSLLFTSHAQILPVKVLTQEQDQWCWAGVSQCILDYYGVEVEQCVIAEYTRTVATWHNFGLTSCCTNPGGPCNYWNYNWGYRGSIEDILMHFGQVDNARSYTALSHARIAQELSIGRPFIIRWGWTFGGGHFVVGHGIDGLTLYYMDPWFGEGAKFANYNWVVSSDLHTWTHTNIMYSTPVSIDDILTSEEDVTEVKVYPNPSDGLINVVVAEKSIVKIFDSMGKQIDLHAVNAHSKLRLNQPAGMYFIHVESNGKISTHKIIVQK